jgi:hypothetical protein
MRGPDADRQCRACGLDHKCCDAIALGFGQLVGFAEDAKDGHAIDARAARELGELAKARFIKRAVCFERRRRDVVDAGQVFEHGWVSSPESWVLKFIATAHPENG